jgi:hypothetical protein
MSSAPQPPQIPAQVPFKSGQPEFSDEHNRTFSGLSDSMRAFANLMKILGAVFGLLLIVAIIAAVVMKGKPPEGVVEGPMRTGPWGYVLMLAPFAVLFLTFGLWAGNSAASFRKIAESKNEDVWNLMNALGSLSKMFALLRFLVIGALILLVLGAAVVGLGAMIDK